MPARLARDLGAHILTETMERRPDIGLGSYDRFFPNQDTLPEGGLGNLFVHAARKLHAEASGEARARSASEAFLFRRLETLPATTGQFRLNVLLPIAFQAQSQMEVDFLAEDVGQQLNHVLDTILRTLAHCQR